MFYNQTDSIIKPQFLSDDVKNEEFKRITANDTFYLLVSAGFVVVWLIIHTRSTFLTLFCIFIIAFSFGITGMLCEYAVGMTYFNLFNNFATFIILGIAADDFFIFFDAWNQSGQFQAVKKDHKRRLAFTLRRSIRAMLMTSLTTSVAFLATYFSPIMPIKAFGIFSSVLVFTVFVMTCLFLPPAVIVYDTHFSSMCSCDKVKNESEGQFGHPHGGQ